MSKALIRIAITPPEFFSQEASMIIDRLCSGNFDYVHIRHPHSRASDVGKLIDSIPSHLHSRLTLHDHFGLTEFYNIGGIHLNSRNTDFFSQQTSNFYPRINKIRVSRSCHSLEEIKKANDMDYVTLSPIFDSISKIGYKSAFPESEWDTLSAFLTSIDTPIVALGGITPSRIPVIESIGFKGYAMLGAAWE